MQRNTSEWSGGRDWKDDFPEWEPVHRILFKNGILGIENVGGDIDKVTGKRCTFAFFPWNWDRGDGCIIRLVAIIDPKGELSHRTRGEVLMIVRKLSEAKTYEAPNHRDYKSLRMFGAEIGGTQNLVFGISHFLPGGGAGPDASPPEKIYHMLDGELTVIAGGKERCAQKGDTVFIAPNENREIVNRGNERVHDAGRGRAGGEVIVSRARCSSRDARSAGPPLQFDGGPGSAAQPSRRARGTRKARRTQCPTTS